MSDLNGKVIWIDVDQIDQPDIPRESNDQEIDDLAVDIQKNSQLEAGMVEPNPQPIDPPEENGGTRKPWKLVFGWHRLQAIRKLQWKQMKCEVREGLTPLQRFQIILSENAKRSGASPFFQAKLIQRMQAELKSANPDATQKDLAISAGMSESDVSDFLAIGLIPEDLKRKFDASNFSFKRLREIIRAENSDQMRQVSEAAMQKSLSAEAINVLVKKLKKPVRQARAKTDGGASKLWPGLPEGVQFKSQARYHHMIWLEERYSKAFLSQILESAPESIPVKRRAAPGKPRKNRGNRPPQEAGNLPNSPHPTPIQESPQTGMNSQA